MNWQTIHLVATTYQTAIVGILGFSGVIITLHMNAKIARDNRRDSAQHNRTVLRTALIEELKIIQTACELNIKVTDEAIEDGSKGVLVPLENLTAVYDSQLQNIGLLTSEEVAKVLHAYLVVKREPMQLRVFPDAEVQHGHFLNIRKEHVKDLNRLKKDMSNAIGTALKTLDQHRSD